MVAGGGGLALLLGSVWSCCSSGIAIDETFRKPFEELRDAVTLHPDELKRRDEIKRVIEETRRKAEELVKNAGLGTASDETAGAARRRGRRLCHRGCADRLADAHGGAAGTATPPDADATALSRRGASGATHRAAARDRGRAAHPPRSAARTPAHLEHGLRCCQQDADPLGGGSAPAVVAAAPPAHPAAAAGASETKENVASARPNGGSLLAFSAAPPAESRPA